MIRGFVVCGEIGQACPVKCGMPSHDGKIVDFPLSYLPRPWGWGLKVEIQLFSSTASTQPNTTKIFVPGHHAQIQEFFVRGGGGVQAPQLILLFKDGFPMVLLHISQGGGPTFSRGGAPIETHITITCDFPGGGGRVWTPYPPSGSAHGYCGILARIGSDEPVRPLFKLRNFKC